MSSQSDVIWVKVYQGSKLCHSSPLVDTIELGRQRPDEEPPVSFDPGKGRLIIAPMHGKLVSREHLRLSKATQDADDSTVRLWNLSKKRSLWIDNDQRLAPGESCDRRLPVLVTLENFAIRVERSFEESNWELLSLDHRTLAPGARAGQDDQYFSRSITQLADQSLAAQDSDGLDRHKLLGWLGAAMEVLQSASGSSDFMQQAAESAERIVRLDEVLALSFADGQWSVVASRSRAGGQTHSSPSKTMLDRVLTLKSTVRRVPQHSAAQSLQGIDALVIAPILDLSGEVIGALYGVRRAHSSSGPDISEIEATMVEVLACGAAAGLARQDERQKAIAAQVRFEQFFTPQLARELEINPQLLDTQEADVSVMFCDIAGFSSIAARISPQLTMQWIQAVMDRLSDVILKHNGVLVDYIGDELMAMWGAPKSQPNHNELACLASQELLDCRRDIDAQWLQKIGSPTDIRIGIASGLASVGNTGSTKKFKYGPLGDTVNLASRLQGASKFFGIHTLVSQATTQFETSTRGMLFRPLGTALLAGLSTPTSIAQPLSPTDENRALAQQWQQLIEMIYSRDKGFNAALSETARAFPQDKATQMLCERGKTSDLTEAPEPLWQFSHK